MATIDELIKELYTQVGDNDRVEPNISDNEYTTILNNAAKEYSRIKGYIKFDETQTYDNTINIYVLPTDCYKVKSVQLKYSKYFLSYVDNTDQIYFEKEYDVTPEVMRITYTKYFKPIEVIDRETDLLLLYAEALCYKLMASKSAELFKFVTGEKTIDEDNVSKKYLQLYNNTVKTFRDRVVKAYGVRANNPKENLDYPLPYPIDGEMP